MKKLFNIIFCAVIGLGMVSIATIPLYAQMEDEVIMYEESDDWDTYEVDLDWEDDTWEWEDESWETTTSTSYDGSEELSNLLGGFSLLAGGVALIFAITLSLGFYIYFALALMTIAKKLNHPNELFAWIPILNAILIFQMGDKNPLLLLLALIPGLGGLIVSVVGIIAIMNICEKRGYDKLLGLLSLIPLANLVLFGILAWGKSPSHKPLGREV